MTLQSKSGNSFDIASLTIALLRASNIPARYAHTTIQVKSEKFKNWVGGFSDINSASTYAASDFYPSRGVKNYKADLWTLLDLTLLFCGYKQKYFIKSL